MKSITREQFLNMKKSLGGDLWNEYKLCAIAFTKFPTAMEIRYSLGTGLWCNLNYTTISGDEKEGQIYDSDPYHSQEVLALSPEQFKRYKEIKALEVLIPELEKSLNNFGSRHVGTPAHTSLKYAIEVSRERFSELYNDDTFKKFLIRKKMDETFPKG